MTAWGLGRFIGYRLLLMTALVSAISVIVFALLHLAPGSPEQAIIGPGPTNPQTVATVKAKYGLDEPVHVQYTQWAWRSLHLDFGTSLRTGEDVKTGILRSSGVTFGLAGLAFGFAMISGVLLGVLAAVKRQTLLDRFLVAIGVAGVASPGFATGTFLLFILAIKFRWFPAFGPGVGAADRLWHLVLPAIALGFSCMGLILSLTRVAMIRELERDYVAFARARGLSEVRVLVAHAFRNSLVPVVTAGGSILAYMLSGAVLVEATFALPGLGSLLVDSVNAEDVPMVQGLSMMIMVIVMVVNLLVDLAYMAVDPRIRVARGSREG